MWITYTLVAISVLSIALAIFGWRLYTNAIKRDIATSEVLCGVLLSPALHIEFQQIAYDRIEARFPNGEKRPSEVEIYGLQNELMTLLADTAWTFVNTNGAGATLRRILTGPFVVGRKANELWRYAKPQ